jgi:Ca2+-binding EF-hand superfamily protein
MKYQNVLTALALAAVTGAAFSSAALADRGPKGDMQGMEMGGPGMGPRFDFAAVDGDKDGKVTEAELTAWRAAEAGKIDANKDGKLSAEELTAARVAEMTARATEMATQMVADLDTDGDGLLTAAEMAARPGPARMFDRADADGDGAITQAELDAMHAEGPRGDGEGRGHGGHGWRFWRN